MDKRKEPGIMIEQIRLLRSNIEFVNIDGGTTYNLRLVSFKRVESSDGNAMDIFAGFDIMHDVKNPLFKFTCDFIKRTKMVSFKPST